MGLCETSVAQNPMVDHNFSHVETLTKLGCNCCNFPRFVTVWLYISLHITITITIIIIINIHMLLNPI